MAAPRVGVLALQGDFREHLLVLRALGADARAVRTPEELASVDGLVVPGGESSVIDKLSRQFGLAEAINRAACAGLPMFGTCAGLIMLADRILDGAPGQRSFGGLDIAVRRNAFGRQADSFEARIGVPELGEPPVHSIFIRAPLVVDAGPAVTVLATLNDGSIVAVQQHNILGTSFHPEITGERRFHIRFLELVQARAAAHS